MAQLLRVTNVNNGVLLIDTMKIKRFVSNFRAHEFRSQDRIFDETLDTHAHTHTHIYT